MLILFHSKMLQEDSNGESSFEIIEKKSQLTTNNEKAGNTYVNNYLIQIK